MTKMNNKFFTKSHERIQEKAYEMDKPEFTLWAQGLTAGIQYAYLKASDNPNAPSLEEVMEKSFVIALLQFKAAMMEKALEIITDGEDD